MNKIFVIAAREFKAAVLNKAFLISLVLMPVMILISSNVSRLAQGWKSRDTRTIAIIDQTPGQAVGAVASMDLLREMESTRLASAGGESLLSGSLGLLFFEAVSPVDASEDPQAALRQRYELGERVRAGELAAFFEIGPASLEQKPANPDDGAVTYYTDRALDRDVLMGVGVKLVTLVQLQRSASLNPLLWARKDRRYTPVELANLTEAAGKSAGKGLVQRELPKLDETGTVREGKEIVPGLKTLIPFLAATLLFFVVLVGASPQLHGVLEEKMNRIGEVLLGSATPFQVLGGKLLGMTATGLLLSMVYMGGGLIAARHWNLDADLRPDLPLWFLLFQSLALLLFGSLFIAVGSACSDMKQAQTLLMPVSLCLSLPMLVLLPVVEDPTGSLARYLSLFPLATPMLMMARLASAPNLPLWEPLVGSGLVLVATILAVWIAGRIFRIGYLSLGKAPSMVEMCRWIFSRS